MWRMGLALDVSPGSPQMLKNGGLSGGTGVVRMKEGEGPWCLRKRVPRQQGNIGVWVRGEEVGYRPYVVESLRDSANRFYFGFKVLVEIHIKAIAVDVSVPLCGSSVDVQKQGRGAQVSNTHTSTNIWVSERGGGGEHFLFTGHSHSAYMYPERSGLQGR